MKSVYYHDRIVYYSRWFYSDHWIVYYEEVLSITHVELSIIMMKLSITARDSAPIIELSINKEVLSIMKMFLSITHVELSIIMMKLSITAGDSAPIIGLSINKEVLSIMMTILSITPAELSIIL